MKALSAVESHPVARAAVVVARGLVGLHAGLMFRSGRESVTLLHLASHYKLRAEPIGPAWWYAQPAIDALDLDVLAGFCAVRAKVGRRVPYGLRYEESTFDRDGSFLAGPGETGLTCATFVLAMFNWAKIPLIDSNSWPYRPEDVEAQKVLVVWLRNNPEVERAHVERVEKETGCLRFRAEEVAAATTFSERPAAFAAIAPASLSIRALVP